MNLDLFYYWVLTFEICCHWKSKSGTLVPHFATHHMMPHEKLEMCKTASWAHGQKKRFKSSLVVFTLQGHAVV